MSDVIEVSTGYVARPQFVPFHMRTTRWYVMVAHRRAGKTVAAVNDLIDAALDCNLPDPKFGYVMPFYAQAKDFVWPYLKSYTDAIPGRGVNEGDLMVTLPGNRRIRLYGADNHKRMQGGYFDGVVLDEYQHMDPGAWTESVRPMLSDRNGWAVFCGKPDGINDFHDKWERTKVDPEWDGLMLPASKTGILSDVELASARKDMSEDRYQAEYECSFEAAMVGSYFAKLMGDAEAEGRIGDVPYDSRAAVDTWWDIGRRDTNAIWFTQNDGRMVNVIDYVEDSFQGLPFYVKELQAKPYVYGKHYFPHDIAVAEWGTGVGRMSLAQGLLGKDRCDMVPRVEDKQDAIEAVRTFLPKCRFDRARTARGRLALVSYHKKYDEARRVYSSHPEHDWASNGADAFQQLAMGHRFAQPAKPKQQVNLGRVGRTWMGG